MSTPEGKVKDKVKRAIKRLRSEGWRIWSFMPVQMGYGSPALDFLFCINGRFVSIETKIPGKVMTPRQEQTAADMQAAGGLVFVVFDDTSLKIAFEQIRKECK